MKILHSKFNSLFIIGLALLLGACSSKTMVESDLDIAGAPDWVNKGTQFLNDRGGRLFHGVGEAPKVGSNSLQKSTADNRARTEVARIFSSFMDAVSTDYTSAASSGGSGVSEQALSQQIKSVTKVNLSGVKIIARWKDKKTNIIYSLAELDLEKVKGTVNTTKNMNSDLKRYISSNSANIFDKMSTGE
ncbi:MAG: LPP20 family lipoprotein [Gammaproteobacteria bacterium]|nr:LPP20 family lipoprotein [Gammaproteobacteria bacterium]